MIMKIIQTIHNFLKKPIIVFLFFALVLYFLIVSFIYQFDAQELYKYEQGDIVTSDIIIPKDISYTDQDGIEREKQLIKKQVPPTYIVDQSIYFEEIARWDSLIKHLNTTNIEITSNNEYLKDFFSIDSVPDEIIEFVVELSNNKEYYESFKYFLTQVYERGVTRKSYKEINKNLAGLVNIVWKKKNSVVSKTRDAKLFLNSDNISEELNYLFINNFENMPISNANTITKYINTRLNKNVEFDKMKTNQMVQAKINNYVPTTEILKKGKIIVRHGEEVTKEDLKYIQIINKVSKKIDYSSIILNSFVYFLHLIILFYILLIYDNTFFNRYRNILYLFFNYGLIVVFFYIASFFKSSDFLLFYIIPIGLLNYFIMLTYDKKISYILISSISLFLFIISRFDIYIFMYSWLLNSLLITISQKELKLKKVVYYKSAIIFVFNILFGYVFLIFSKDVNLNPFNILLLSIVNTLVCSILFFGFLPIIENLFNFATFYKLMELSDLNNPIFNELLVKAPGTYHHSIIVSNLAEKAAIECGANPYLARTGALYHDLGKMRHAKYFIENQNSAANLSKTLNPTMAVAIIKNHVKLGVEYGKKLKLPVEILDIVKEHHGNATITYFYNKVLEYKDKRSKNVVKADYSYDYPRPTTKESAIVMLADTIEAASRTFDTTNLNAIERKIYELVDNKFLEGQLNASPLTLKDLNLIKSSFYENISAMFHQRIDYPDSDNIRSLEKELKRGIPKQESRDE